MEKASVLTVKLHDKPIGTITNIGNDRSIFAFNNDYINDKNRDTLSLSFKDNIGQLITDFRPYNTKPMPFFSNLLPEGYMRNYLAKIAQIHPEREFHLLEALGSDLPGAITVTADNSKPYISPSKLSETKYENKEFFSDVIENTMRFSLAGVQLKFSALTNTNGGLTIPINGIGGHWIIKLPSREFKNVPENEFSMMTLASMVGINVPVIDLIDTSSIENLPTTIKQLGSTAFVIKRFDRNDDGLRIHTEDFAQVFGIYPHNKYEKASYRNIARVIAAESDNDDIIEFIRRATFNVLIGNGDMHLKNWSLIYKDKKRAKLSPAYDFVSTITYIPGEKSALKFSRSKSFSDFTISELEHLASKASIPSKLVINTAKETVNLFMHYWNNEKNHLPMSNEVRIAIDRHLKELPIVLS